MKASFGSKGSGFLSLLLCCTAGAGSLLDNTDKSSSIIRRKRKEQKEVSSVADDEPERLRIKTDLPAIQQEQADISTTPNSIPQQMPEVMKRACCTNCVCVLTPILLGHTPLAALGHRACWTKVPGSRFGRNAGAQLVQSKVSTAKNVCVCF